LVAIGASAGGVPALLQIAPDLTAGFPAPIVIVMHIGAHRSVLPALLNDVGPNHAQFAESGMVPEAGVIYVAPSDQHLLLEDGMFRLFRGPKVHHTRPAIDPLFRSVALELGRRAVGVILTGMLEDGAAGLYAIKECGGTAVVQDPHSAVEPSMPDSAAAITAVDHIRGLDHMAKLLNSLGDPLTDALTPVVPDWLRAEQAVTLGRAEMPELASIGFAAGLTCPDCGGALFELREGRPLRFLCHTGHAFGLHSLAWAHSQITEDRLFSGLRAVQEKEAILRRLAQEQARDHSGSEIAALDEAANLGALAQRIKDVLANLPSATRLPADRDV
jgi:two-component system chemotaxis response regulator CheB